jgi:hypothetical protein
MEFALVLRELWSRRRIVSVGILVGVLVAMLSVYRLDGLSLKPRALQFSSASTQLFVDTPTTALGDVNANVSQLQTMATVLANFMASPTVVDLIGKQVGLSGQQIYAAGPVVLNQPRSVVEPTQLKRNVEVTGETIPYRIEFLNDPSLPTIGINTQAPTTAMAIRLADASVTALQQYVTTLEENSSTPRQQRVVIRPLGHALGGVVNSGISKKLAAMIGIAVFFLWCVLVLVGVRFRQAWKASAEVSRRTRVQPGSLTANGNERHGGKLKPAEATAPLRGPQMSVDRRRSGTRSARPESRNGTQDISSALSQTDLD